MESCSLCSITFTSLNDYKAHLKLHFDNNGTAIEKCSLCNEIFSSQDEYKIHLKTHIGNVETMETCPVCQQSFSTAEDFQTHLRLNSEGVLVCEIDKNGEICTLCHKSFESKDEFKVHLQTHIKSEKTVETCLKECSPHDGYETSIHNQGNSTLPSGFKLNNVNVVKSEITTESLVPTEQHEAFKKNCTICDQVFTNEADFNCHKETHLNGSGIKVWHCLTCNQTFYSHDLFKNHVHSHVSSYLECLRCKKTFRDPKHFELHQRIHFLENELKPQKKFQKPFVRQHQCSVCEKSFTQQKQLEAHQRIHILEKTRFNCYVCSAKFHTTESLKTHLKRHEVANYFACQICHKTFLRAELLLSHMKTHKDLEKYLECKICAELTENMVEHMKEKHPDANNYVCKHCGQSFPRASLFVSHMKTHFVKENENTANPILYTCNLCKETFPNSDKLAQHMNMHHYFELCKHCGERIENGKMEIHLKESHSVVSPYLCKLCGVSFLSAGSLVQHVKTHTATGDMTVFTKIKQCNLCSDNVENLTQHLAEKHHVEIPTLASPHMCKLCGESFLGAGSLMHHMKSHTLNEILPNPVELHQCNLCPEVVVDLTQHLKVKHQLENQYTCKGCDQRFFRADQLVTHLSTCKLKTMCKLCGHSGEMCPCFKEEKRVFKCEPCNRVFLNEDLYLRHTKKLSHKHLVLKKSQNSLVGSVTLTDNMLERPVRSDIVHVPGQALSSKRKAECLEEKPQFPCNKCDKVLPFRELLVLHRAQGCGNLITKVDIPKMHPEMFICGVCDSKFSEGEQLEIHMKTHSVKISCYFCIKTFTSEALLDSHLQTHKNDSSFVCRKCGKRVKSLKTMISHFQSHSKYLCKICRKLFSSRFSLETHRKVHAKWPPHLCSFCKMSFRWGANLQNHVRLTHSNVNLPLFKRRSKRNVSNSDKSKVHSCRRCPTTFSSMLAVLSHTQTQHCEDNHMWHKCFRCRRHFKTRLGLKFHMGRTHHNSTSVRNRHGRVGKNNGICRNQSVTEEGCGESTAKDVTFTCGMCGDVFPCCDTLTKHMERDHL